MSDRRGDNIHALSPVDALGLPVEIPVPQAAKILGVNVKTARKYVDEGRLRWRDVAASQGRRVIRIELASVLEMRTGYTTSVPAATPPPPQPRRRASRANACQKFKHVKIGR